MRSVGEMCMNESKGRMEGEAEGTTKYGKFDEALSSDESLKFVIC
jgi:hypothetical protein